MSVSYEFRRSVEEVVRAIKAAVGASQKPQTTVVAIAAPTTVTISGTGAVALTAATLNDAGAAAVGVWVRVTFTSATAGAIGQVFGRNVAAAPVVDAVTQVANQISTTGGFVPLTGAQAYYRVLAAVGAWTLTIEVNSYAELA